MTPPDLDQVSNAAQAAGGGGGIAALAAAVIAWFRGAGKRIAAVESRMSSKVDTTTFSERIAVIEEKVDAKAEASRVETIAGNLTEAFKQQREDAQRTVDAIARIADSHHEFTQHVLTELGKRPTRDECVHILHRRD